MLEMPDRSAASESAESINLKALTMRASLIGLHRSAANFLLGRMLWQVRNDQEMGRAELLGAAAKPLKTHPGLS